MNRHVIAGLVFLSLVAALVVPVSAFAHCDTINGPVVADARKALNSGNVTPVLKWVNKKFEPEIRSAFAQSLKVRVSGPEAKELADNYFFETLVRLHRAGEGAPYTGLKPAASVDPAVAGADKALEQGSIDGLARDMAAQVERGIRQRFALALQAKKSAGTSVEAGREYVESYVKLMHYLENLDLVAQGKVEAEH